MTKTAFPRESLPRFDEIHPEQIEPTVRQLLASHREKLKQLLAQPQPYPWENLMQPLEAMEDELHHYWSPISHLHGVMGSDALRHGFNAALPLITEYHTELSLNTDLFHAIESMTQHPSFYTLSSAQQKILANEIRDFKLAGVHLPEKEKLKLTALEQELSTLTTRFAENLLDATQAWSLHLTDEKKLAGLTAQARQLARDNAKRDKKPGYLITLDYPSYSTAMRFLQQRELRQTLYEAYITRASDCGPHAGKWDNSSIMENILKIRHEIAQLVGFNHYANFSLATKMAKDPQKILDFIHDLIQKSHVLAKKEYEEIVNFAFATDHITDFSNWDLAYYSEKLSEKKFHFSSEELRPYFPIDHVLQGLFAIAQQLFGIKIYEEKNINTWHPAVRFFSVYDEKNELRAGFYIDLYARPHKRDGAWMDDCCARRHHNNLMQYPVAYLTCNFMPPVGDQPALLDHDEVITLFHEFGHCLHHMLTMVDYPGVAGINGVPWDAVEFPSQFMENFCWQKETLSLMAKHYQTGESLPDELFQKMLAAKHFMAGMAMLRQLEFSLFDFRLHLEYDAVKPTSIQQILDEVRQLTALAPIPTFNRFQHSFSHIFAGGYAAGYYSYKWAEVLSADAFSLFEERGILDAKTGHDFMKNILEVGGVTDPMAAFVAFRGREPTVDALLRQNGIG